MNSNGLALGYTSPIGASRLLANGETDRHRWLLQAQRVLEPVFGCHCEIYTHDPKHRTPFKKMRTDRRGRIS